MSVAMGQSSAVRAVVSTSASNAEPILAPGNARALDALIRARFPRTLAVEAGPVAVAVTLAARGRLVARLAAAARDVAGDGARATGLGTLAAIVDGETDGVDGADTDKLDKSAGSKKGSAKPGVGKNSSKGGKNAKSARDAEEPAAGAGTAEWLEAEAIRLLAKLTRAGSGDDSDDEDDGDGDAASAGRSLGGGRKGAADAKGSKSGQSAKKGSSSRKGKGNNGGGNDDGDNDDDDAAARAAEARARGDNVRAWTVAMATISRAELDVALGRETEGIRALSGLLSVVEGAAPASPSASSASSMSSTLLRSSLTAMPAFPPDLGLGASTLPRLILDIRVRLARALRLQLRDAAADALEAQTTAFAVALGDVFTLTQCLTGDARVAAARRASRTGRCGSRFFFFFFSNFFFSIFFFFNLTSHPCLNHFFSSSMYTHTHTHTATADWDRGGGDILAHALLDRARELSREEPQRAIVMLDEAARVATQTAAHRGTDLHAGPLAASGGVHEPLAATVAEAHTVRAMLLCHHCPDPLAAVAAARLALSAARGCANLSPPARARVLLATGRALRIASQHDDSTGGFDASWPPTSSSPARGDGHRHRDSGGQVIDALGGRGHPADKGAPLPVVSADGHNAVLMAGNAARALKGALAATVVIGDHDHEFAQTVCLELAMLFHVQHLAGGPIATTSAASAASATPAASAVSAAAPREWLRLAAWFHRRSLELTDCRAIAAEGFAPSWEDDLPAFARADIAEAAANYDRARGIVVPAAGDDAAAAAAAAADQLVNSGGKSSGKSKSNAGAGSNAGVGSTNLGGVSPESVLAYRLALAREHRVRRAGDGASIDDGRVLLHRHMAEAYTGYAARCIGALPRGNPAAASVVETLDGTAIDLSGLGAAGGSCAQWLDADANSAAATAHGALEPRPRTSFATGGGPGAEITGCEVLIFALELSADHEAGDGRNSGGIHAGDDGDDGATPRSPRAGSASGKKSGSAAAGSSSSKKRGKGGDAAAAAADAAAAAAAAADAASRTRTIVSSIAMRPAVARAVRSALHDARVKLLAMAPAAAVGGQGDAVDSSPATPSPRDGLPDETSDAGMAVLVRDLVALVRGVAEASEDDIAQVCGGDPWPAVAECLDGLFDRIRCAEISGAAERLLALAAGARVPDAAAVVAR
jgi:hypothetical protein